ncbi:MAG: class I SAM-dependent methyltransferase [Spirochaetes bacterium]|nr:class I SAM-dependent methyltransferase [Spirochaetota bacterium]
MKFLFFYCIGAVLIFIGIMALWRRYNWPCPSWLALLLENPYIEAVAGSSLLLDRISLKSGMRLLDIGCGPGRLSIPAAERLKAKGEVLALDVQPAMLRKVKERIKVKGLKNIRTQLGGIGKVKLKQNYFDRAILVTVLGEIPHRKKALAVIYKTMKSGGILSITEVIPDPHYQSRKKVRELAESVGFRLKASYGTWLAFTMNFIK